MNNMIASPHSVLKEVFGYENFRLHQESIIESVLQGNDTFAIMPTGGGKSLCYQIPALVNEGLCLVISPLIALMKDQVDALVIQGIEAAYLNSTQSSGEQNDVFRRLKEGNIKLLYLAPERLFDESDFFLNFLTTLNVSLVAIDEAHCISSWGHDFRPVYLKLAKLKDKLENVPVIALTATADKITQKDIVEKLELQEAKTFISSFNRANITYHVSAKNDSFKQLVEFLNGFKNESGIIYCLSRDSTERTAAKLSEYGYEAEAYHAGMSPEQRGDVQERFIKDELKIVVATIAFGMGIDKSNVRFVVHLDLPKNIESFYQETGRAGRDGLPSTTLLFYSYGDVFRLRNFIKDDGDPDQVEIQTKKLERMAEFGALTTCRRRYLLNYFGEDAEDNCGSCDNCQNKRETFDGTEVAQMALSAIARLKENYGMNLVIDFLRGSKSEKIKSFMKELPTYGLGQSKSKQEWIHYFKELLRQDLVSKTEDQYPILNLNKASWQVLKGNLKVTMNKPITQTFATETVSEETYDKLLFEELRSWRRDEANASGLAPYMIFSDATLKQLSTYLPLQHSDLMQITGFGQVKIQKFGMEVLQIIRNYAAERDLSTRMHLKKGIKSPVVKKKTETSRRSGGTQDVTYKLYKDGMSIEEIVSNRNLSLSTIENHLSTFIESGDLAIDELVSSENQDLIRKQIDIHGWVSLRSLKDNLPDNIDYGQIRWVVSDVRREVNEK
ncbi:MAG: DNA helicase RecQ [bacterium]|nr:DNA helicase RecQ [bacterium]